MTTVIIHPSQLHGMIIPPASKAISHRALILFAFSLPGSQIENLLASADVQATKQALVQMGAEFTEKNNTLILKQSARTGGGEIDCMNSGTTLRLFTGISSLFANRTTLRGDSSLMTRPVGALVESLQMLGAEISTTSGKPPVVINKPMSSDQLHTEIRGNESSQYISALLLTAALRDGLTTEIILHPPVVSRPYIDLTIQMLRQRGIEIITIDSGYRVAGTKTFGQSNLQVPADLSSAAFFIVAGALPSNLIKIRQISFDYPQADGRIIEIVKQAGAEIRHEGNELTIKGSEVHAVEVDLSDCPDLFPILCVLAACAEGTSKLYNAKHLRLKETDRIKTMLANLEKVGIHFEELEDGALITGGQIHGGVELDSFHDHRIAMACAILASQADSPCEIINAECVDVSYPNFYETMEKLKD